jgi:hypothetical protein
LSGVAVLAAVKIAELPLFQQLSFVISDAISRKLGTGNSGHVVLVRLDQSLSKAQLQLLMSRSIPTLVTEFGATAVGVDIDFSIGGYSQLSKDYAKWSHANPWLSSRVVWAGGYVNPPVTNATPPPDRSALCDDCSDIACTSRFVPKSVFGDSEEPSNYAMAVAFRSIDEKNRSSARFVCHAQTEMPLKSFHFTLVEIYCKGRTDIVTCRDLQPNKQAETQLHAWYQSVPLDLCALVGCSDADMGKPLKTSTDLFSNKIVILYSDVPSNDEHMTIVGMRKGADIIASLVENELQFGVAPQWRVLFMKWLLEGIITLLLIFLFHWRYTQQWAILIAGGLFVVYVYFVPRLSTWVPDFRNYVLAVILAFWLEVLLKSAWQSVVGEKPHSDNSGTTSKRKPSGNEQSASTASPPTTAITTTAIAGSTNPAAVNPTLPAEKRT